MTRRPLTTLQRLIKLVIMGSGRFPPFAQAPERSVPASQVERAVVEAHFREGVGRFIDLVRLLLPARRYDLFVKHPRMGDLTIEEWMRFHVIHARHHARQIRRRLNG